MKTKKLMIALLALGAYFMSNAQSTYEWTQVGATPTTAVSRTGSISIYPSTGEYGLSATNLGLSSFSTVTATPNYSYTLNTSGYKYLYNASPVSCFASITNASGSPSFNTSIINPAANMTSSLTPGLLSFVASTPNGQSAASISNLGNLSLTTPSTLGTVNAISVSHYGSPASFTVSSSGDISTTGMVKIGPSTMATPNTNMYSLYVAKGILTEQVKVAVASSANWSDFVFANNYKLKTIKEVESYIATNKHLPD